MNGFSAHGLDEDAFGEKSDLKGSLRTFDAFRMSFYNLRSRDAIQLIQTNGTSQNKSLLYSPLPPRRPMDRPDSRHLHRPLLLRTLRLVQGYRKPPF